MQTLTRLVVNKLTLNIEKTNYIIFRPRQKAIPFHPNIIVIIFVALYVRMFVAGANKVEATMSWYVEANEILASNR